MTARPGFSLTVHQNEYLSTEDNEMHAVLAVTGQGFGAVADSGPPDAAEVIAIDCSGSMAYPPTKIAAARRATAAAIDTLRDGVHFAVVQGRHAASVAFPAGEQRMVAASPETRQLAKSVVRHLDPNGGTAMGTWLNLAGTLLDAHPGAVRHVMLLTDGKNETETPRELNAVLAEQEGKFVCDARGIGDDWSAKELLRIVSALHGSADAIREDEELVDDFAMMMRGAMSKVVPDLRLRITPSPFARVRFLKQVFPTEADFTEYGTPADDGAIEFSTGSWGEESKHFQLCLDLDRSGLPSDEHILAATVALAMVRPESAEETQGKTETICVHWTDDARRSSVLDREVAHYTGQAELRQAIEAGCDAYDAGNLDVAALEWGRAIELAAGLGNEKSLARLRRLVEFKDQGHVRVKPDLMPRDLLSAAMSSVMSTRSPASMKAQHVPVAGPDRICPDCRRRSPADAMFCTSCQYEFGQGT